MATKSIHFEAKSADTGRLDALVARLTGLSRSRIRGLFDHGGVVLNGAHVANPATAVHGADQVTVRYDPERRYRKKASERATHGFIVVHVDEYLVVVMKEAGLLTVPTDRGERNTLVDRLSHHLNKGNPRGRPVSVVHRLDRDTSGLLVFGRTPRIAASLIDQFAAHKPEREYAAIVAGRVAADKDVIRSRLITDKALNQKSVREGSGLGGEIAVTHFETRARFTDATLVSVQLETGRRNQIRVHFAELNHPVLGDRRYQPRLAEHPAWLYKRLALHAQVLGFRHPVDNRPLRFTAPLPPEFLAFRAEARGRGRPC